MKINCPKQVELWKKIGEQFEDYRILVYENNSKDNTAKQLEEWKNRNPKVWVKSEFLSYVYLMSTIINRNGLEGNKPFRPEMISNARNVVMNEAMSDKYKDYDYVIWIDMDFVIEPDYGGFHNTFESEMEWDAVFAYGITRDKNYRDWFAFKDKNNPLGPELLGHNWWYTRNYSYASKPNDPWHPVYSAFGGCGIYKKEAIRNCRYSSIVTPDLEKLTKELLKDAGNYQVKEYLDLNKEMSGTVLIEKIFPNRRKVEYNKLGILLNTDLDAVVWRMNSGAMQYPACCEHIPFHASMIAQGFNRLYINPKLIFYHDV